MKRILCLLSVFILIFAVVSCGGKKENPAYEEQVSKEIKAEEGGKIESSDGNTSIEIPADALDSDTKITMTIYDVSGYAAIPDKIGGMKVVSKIVEFEPSGTVFKKPVIISMAAGEAFENKIVSAAVFYEQEGRLSYSERGAYGVLGRDAAGDPIMMTAAGDPIMLSDGNLTTGAGDPIMNAAAGDPIMMSAAGDPIMNAAAGDPIMMATGHFTAYTFITIEPKEPGEEPEEPEKDEEVTDKDEEPVVEDDDEPIVDEDEDETPDVDEDEDEIPDEAEDEDIVPEPKVYSKVLCTGQAKCSDGKSIIDCPEEGEELYGQDAQFVAQKSCVPHKYTKIEADQEATAGFTQVYDENTGLRWVMLNEELRLVEAQERCENLEYGGFEDWRIPSAKELLTIADHDWCQPSVRGFYFEGMDFYSYWTSTPALSYGYPNERWIFDTSCGSIYSSAGSIAQGVKVVCVRGEEYGKVSESNYTDNGNTVSDSSTNLVWQKDSVPGKTWKEALKYCNDLEYAGHSDWRLPNKNELVTLIDYSKSAPASSFPGMTSEILWSSTFETFYGGSQGVFVVNTDSAVIGREASSNNFAVRCVRTDTDPKPDGIPFCDETRATPCEDPVTHYVWGPSYMTESGSSSLSWQDKAVRCRESNLGGISKWRIPTIDELRTLVDSSDKLKLDGDCRVTEACRDYYTLECFNEDEDVCSENKLMQSSLYDSGYYVSGTMSNQGVESEEFEYSWAVNLKDGSIKSVSSYDYDRDDSRCIRDNSLPDPLAFPYTDSANSLIWSSLSKKRISYWYDAAKYCTELVEGGSNNWRVPTMEELRTLVKNCPAGYCAPNITGEYSIFGDLSDLWSSEIGNDTVNLLNFMTASEDSQSFYYENFARVRCVRSLSASENIPDLDEESDFPYMLPDLVWSKVSEEEFWDAEEAAEYCSSLNEEGYGGETHWQLPTSSELASIIDKRVCSNKNDFLTGATSGRCSQYTFAGYSYFGDMFSLKAQGGYVFDFAQGSMSSYGYARVRCVVVPPDSGS